MRFLVGFLLGILVGASIGLVLAPQPGSQTPVGTPTAIDAPVHGLTAGSTCVLG